jgi:hypothetical protein
VVSASDDGVELRSHADTALDEPRESGENESYGQPAERGSVRFYRRAGLEARNASLESAFLAIASGDNNPDGSPSSMEAATR